MRRTDLMDTSEWAHREMVRLLREKTPDDRLGMVVDRSEAGLEMHCIAMARVAERRKAWESEKRSERH